MLLTLMFALIVIFLVLAAQFESFRDALIMLLTVPMAIWRCVAGDECVGAHQRHAADAFSPA